jgi:hypothetical protein
MNDFFLAHLDNVADVPPGDQGEEEPLDQKGHRVCIRGRHPGNFLLKLSVPLARRAFAAPPQAAKNGGASPSLVLYLAAEYRHSNSDTK